MRTFTKVLIAAALGVSSAAFAAAPAEPTTREARMAEALKHYREKTAAQAAQPKSAHTAGAMHHGADKKHGAMKHHAKKHAAHTS